MKERTFIEQGMKKIQLEQYMKKNLNKAGFTGLHMVKTPLVTRIVLTVARPGLAIGKGGQNIKMLTEEISQKFSIDNPQIEIQDIKNPALDSKATVDKMVELIERGFNWKSVVFRTVRDISAAGAQGMELVLKGKLSGKGGRKRKHRVIQGYMKKVGNQIELVDRAKASAYPKAGAIGIKLSIIRPEVVFPDKIDFKAALDRKEEPVKEEAEKESPGPEAQAPGKEAAKKEAVEADKQGATEAGVKAGKPESKEDKQETGAAEAGTGRQEAAEAKVEAGKQGATKAGGHEDAKSGAKKLENQETAKAEAKAEKWKAVDAETGAEKQGKGREVVLAKKAGKAKPGRGSGTGKAPKEEKKGKHAVKEGRAEEAKKEK